MWLREKTLESMTLFTYLRAGHVREGRVSSLYQRTKWKERRKLSENRKRFPEQRLTGLSPECLSSESTNLAVHQNWGWIWKMQMLGPIQPF